MVQARATSRCAEVLNALTACVEACEQLVNHGHSPPQSVLKIDRATVLRWAEWSPMLERNPDLADTWLSLCANACKSWVDAYRNDSTEVAQRCVERCEHCIEVCTKALHQSPQKESPTTL
jgi:hypothetical protein